MSLIFTFIKNDGEAVFTKYHGNDKVFVIPETFEGEPVTELGRFFCSSNCFIEEVILPSTIKKIDFLAFDNCENLKKISFNEGLVEISSNAFSGCKSLGEVVFPKSLEMIDFLAFENCEKLKKISFNEGLVEIKRNAFFNCKSLEEVVLPKSLEKIGLTVFGKCRSLKKVILQSDMKFKAEKVFNETPSLNDANYALIRNFSVENQVKFMAKKLSEIDTYTPGEKKELVTYINRRQNLKKAIFSADFPEAISVLIEKKVKLTLELIEECLQKSIENNYLQVTAILLEYKNNNFISTEIESFQEQNELVEIGLELPTIKQLKSKWSVKHIPNGLRIIGYKGENTTEIIPGATAEGTPIIEVSRTGKKTFEPIEKLTIDENIEVLGEKTFFNNNTLKEIILPTTLTKISNLCFTGCSNLEKFDIPESVQIIEGNPFCSCVKLRDENEFIIIRDVLYEYKGTDDIVIVPKRVKYIESGAFFCVYLKEIIFPDKLIEIKESAFCFCNNIEKFTVSKNTKIDENAFNSCSSIKSKLKY